MIETAIRCRRCGERVALVDEHSRCEQCVHDANCLAARLAMFEEHVQALVEEGLNAEQIHEAVTITLSGAGAITGELPFRDPDPHWGGWQVDSMFVDDPRDHERRRPNRIKWARIARRNIEDRARRQAWRPSGRRGAMGERPNAARRAPRRNVAALCSFHLDAHGGPLMARREKPRTERASGPCGTLSAVHGGKPR